MSSRYPGHPFSDGSTILSWRQFLSPALPEVYCRYLFSVDSNAAAYINEEGVKLPGPEGDGFSYRLEHADQSAANPGKYAMFMHAYDENNHFSGGAAQNRALNVAINADQLYCVEIYVKQNTKTGGTWNADGIYRVWIDGVLVLEQVNVKIQSEEDPMSMIDPGTVTNFFANFFHGGSNTPLGRFYYTLGAVVIATVYIGPPVVPTGFTPPYALPGPLEAVEISANTVADVEPAGMSTGKYAQAAFGAYGGGAYVADYSLGGAYAISGSGGHTSPRNIGSLLFDFEDALYKRLDPQGGAYSDTDYLLAATDGAPHYEITGSGGVPAPAHPYNTLVALPTSLGGGAKGSTLYVTRAAITQSSVSSTSAHAEDLDTGDWTRFSTTQSPRVSFNHSAVMDVARSKAWYMPSNQHLYKSVAFLDLTNGEFDVTADGPSFWPDNAQLGCLFMHAGLVIRHGTGLFAFDPDDETAGPVQLTVSGVALPDEQRANPWAYHEGTGCFYKLPIAGGNTVYRLQPPASLPKTNAWVVDTITLTSSLPGYGVPGDGSELVITRWFTVTSLDLIGYIPDGDVYLINPNES
jgi:hypothetical protein